ncbi:MAG: efflux RND transporter periplasmic adaptor subunit [Fimbriimonadaceae bacterium]|nr:efflux RND transporter periplasmic adaptor subunit [Fimbriimonadaceae bacterium]
MMRIRTWNAWLSALPLTAVILLGCSPQEKTSQATASVATVKADTEIVRIAPAAKYYQATGTIRPLLNATLSSKVMARVLSIEPREGDRVRAGQIIVRLDSRELDSSVNMAKANLTSANVGVGSARTAASMESKTSLARIAQAEAQVTQAKGALSAARARLDLAKAGPRTQERSQAKLAVIQAASNMKLAATELERTRKLVDQGALAHRQLDIAQNQFDQAKAQYETAVEAEAIAIEGTRSEDLRAAQESVVQAEASVRQAEAGVRSAKAASMLIKVRQEEIRSAQAQVSQSAAALQSARITADYATVVAPFDGVVVRRFVDPGSMATPGLPLVTIEGGGLRLEAVVPETVLSTVKLGQSVPVAIDALGAQVVSGRVVEIVPQGDASTHSFLVRLALMGNVRMKSGMFGRADIVVGRQPTILIPASATWEVEGLHYVYVVNSEGIARLRIVALGKRSGDRIEALSGLTDGEKVVVGNLDSVRDGVRIEGR